MLIKTTKLMSRPYMEICIDVVKGVLSNPLQSPSTHLVRQSLFAASIDPNLKFDQDNKCWIIYYSDHIPFRGTPFNPQYKISISIPEELFEETLYCQLLKELQ